MHCRRKRGNLSDGTATGRTRSVMLFEAARHEPLQDIDWDAANDTRFGPAT